MAAQPGQRSSDHNGRNHSRRSLLATIQCFESIEINNTSQNIVFSRVLAVEDRLEQELKRNMPEQSIDLLILRQKIHRWFSFYSSPQVDNQVNYRQASFSNNVLKVRALIG